MALPTSTRPNEAGADSETPAALPKGVVLGPDGKPCRSCTSVASWMAMAKGQPSASKSTAAAIPDVLPEDCPPDVERLGRNTWTMLHTMTANYPSNPSPLRQEQTKGFISLFSQLYPCSHCASDFREWLRQPGNKPRVSNRDEFGRWMCEAHNAVNVKLGKPSFDCNKWDERWRTGPPDGRCG